MSSTWETQVFLASSPTTQLAVLGKASGGTFTDILGDVGAGSCEIAKNDPAATAAVLNAGNLVKFLLNGTPVFGFFNRAPTNTVGEAADATVVLAGKSVLNYLDCQVYPAGWTVAGVYSNTRTFTGTAGAMMKTLLDEAQARGALVGLTYDFTASLDSAGNSWVANINMTIPVRASLLDLAKNLYSQGYGIYMDPNLGFHLYDVGRYGTNLSTGAGAVVWRWGRHFIGKVPNTGNSDLRNVCLVEGTAGAFVEVKDTGSVLGTGRLESGLDLSSTTGDTTQMTASGTAQITLLEQSGTAITVPLNHGTGGLYEPYVDYRPGDTIAMDTTPDTTYQMTPEVVQALTLNQLDANNYNIQAQLGSLYIPPNSPMGVQQQLAASSGSSATIGQGGAGGLTLATPKGFPSGVAFPGNPSAGFAFFRTDLGEWYYYDGTRWLSSTLYRDVLVTPQSPMTAYAAAASIGRWTPWADDCDLWITAIYASIYIATTNNASNYWSISPTKYDVNFGSPSAIVTFTTQGVAPNTVVKYKIAVGAAYTPGTYPIVQVEIAKVLSPGGMSPPAIWMSYRKIAT